MTLGLSNIGIGALILACGFWQWRASEASLTTALFVAGAGAVAIGVYQIWRQRYVYQ